jgi:hypothetical protein
MCLLYYVLATITERKMREMRDDVAESVRNIIPDFAPYIGGMARLDLNVPRSYKGTISSIKLEDDGTLHVELDGGKFEYVNILPGNVLEDIGDGKILCNMPFAGRCTLYPSKKK